MLDILLPQITDDVEVIISDNGSTDNTDEIIQNYRNLYPFIKYTRSEVNEGADSNFLKCMLNAKGKFVMLISDDDIVMENAVKRIVDYLTMHPDISMAYLDSVAFKDYYKGPEYCHRYKEYSQKIDRDKDTTDKKEFLRYSQRLFGFTSCHIWSTERIHNITNPERFKGTYFMQAYISILCSNNPNDKLGLIAGPCIAVGEYGSLGNYNLAKVEGEYYQKMVEFASENDYPKKQMRKYYAWKIVFLGRMYIIRERAIAVSMTRCKDLFKVTYQFPRAWIGLYPFFFIPGSLCKWIVCVIRKKQGRDFTSYVNRPTD